MKEENKRKKYIVYSFILRFLVIAVLLLFFIIGLKLAVESNGRTGIEKENGEKEEVLKENFVFVEEETYLVTDKEYYRIGHPVENEAEYYLTVMKDDSFYSLMVPQKVYLTHYPSGNITVQVGKDSSYVLSADGTDIYSRTTIPLEDK